ncbi:hypothetical protein EIN_424860 [Entamoeba invadens IP1]|uniref:Leucine-rich repeat containing protein n=1 Tax=Entamoeba invadens IP1 TaxID=370355 RepID=A0A0A1UBT3_ENTIV|nr:hypothetical protein EIN_424860 [Entamoeba invadens IP1]ELP89764.1 hypothetical protein EIN_424860 [Entamoeba invadens IP1]|eukprot:XP_004256535.1 hypothetical protein EIN_424860 [Entamoeba invadens IP1]
MSALSQEIGRYLDSFIKSITASKTGDIELTPPLVMLLNGFSHPCFGNKEAYADFLRDLRHVTIVPEKVDMYSDNQWKEMIKLPIGFVSSCRITRFVLRNLDQVFVDLGTPGLGDSLVELNVTSCQIRNLEIFLGSTQEVVWKRLKKLIITGCKIREIPVGVFSLKLYPKLQMLDLSKNEIKIIENVEELKLDTLILNNNKLYQCYLYCTPYLKNLFVDCNDFESLDGFQAFEGLECLSIRKNHLHFTDKDKDCFKLLKCLCELDVSENPCGDARQRFLSALPNLSEHLEFIFNEDDVPMKEIGKVMREQKVDLTEQSIVANIKANLDINKENNKKNWVEKVDKWEIDSHTAVVLPQLRKENRYISFMQYMVSDVKNKPYEMVQQDVKTVVELKKICNVKVGVFLSEKNNEGRGDENVFPMTFISPLQDFERFYVRLGEIKNNIRFVVAIDTLVQAIIDERKLVKNVCVDCVNQIARKYNGRIIRLVLPVEKNSAREKIQKVIDVLNANEDLINDNSIRRDGRFLFVQQALKILRQVSEIDRSSIGDEEKKKQLDDYVKQQITPIRKEMKKTDFAISITQSSTREANFLESKQPKKVGEVDKNVVESVPEVATEEVTEEVQTPKEPRVSLSAKKPSRRLSMRLKKKTQEEQKSEPRSKDISNSLSQLLEDKSEATDSSEDKREEPKIEEFNIESPKEEIKENTNVPEFTKLDVKTTGDLSSSKALEVEESSVPKSTHRVARGGKGRKKATKNAFKVGSKDLKEEDVVHVEADDTTPTTSKTETTTEGSAEEIKPKKPIGGQQMMPGLGMAQLQGIRLKKIDKN